MDRPQAHSPAPNSLAAARIGPAVPSIDPDQHKTWTLVAFTAALTALKGVGAISYDEMTE